jgi:hypothetical protein
MVLVDHAVRQSHARHHDERAGAEPGRGQGPIPDQLAEVPHGLDSYRAPFYLAPASAPSFHCAARSSVERDMVSIIEQIQHDALDRSVRVSDLLRRVKLAATKLKRFLHWRKRHGG